jgi:stage V sporulation protein S
MNRFLSKLDLRDIKIDPRGSRFPPDEEAYERETTRSPVSEREATQPFPAETAIAEAPAVEPVAATAIAETDIPSTAAAINSEERAERQVVAELIASGEVLKVSARSRPSAVAGAIAGVVREAGRAEVQAIGAGATNQAVKAVAIARDYLRETGIDAVCLPEFIDVTIDNEDRTAIKLVIEPR